MGKNRSSLSAGTWLALVLPVLLPFTSARADLVGVEFDPGQPSILSFQGSVTYSAASQTFHSDMTPLTFSAPFVAGGFTPFTGTGKTSIDLLVDSNGAFVANGTGVSVTGSVNINGTGYTGTDADPLLFGHIISFGAEAAGPPTRLFDGLFVVDGGELIGAGGFFIGEKAGFIIYAENVTTGTLGDFKQDFKSTTDKSELGPVIPEPRTLFLGCLALGLFAGYGLLRKAAFRR
jgi:hypothetical protein